MSLANGNKRSRDEHDTNGRDSVAHAPKKTKLLSDDDDGDDSGIENGGISLRVNEEYARRFEYNKKREEKHRLEEKYGKTKALDDGEDSDDSEAGVEEDDGGEFATEALDEEITATLQALQSKDPRIYDSSVNFFREPEQAGTSGAAKEPSMTLKQYHTKNLLEDDAEDDQVPVRTYAQEQEDARQQLVRELQAAVRSENGEEEEEDFLVTKKRTNPPKEKVAKITVDDVAQADRDPETFLSNFMASRAWVPKDTSQFQPLNSDDEDEEAAAEEWENSYNMYFEDTSQANEKLITYARDAVAQTTVRRGDQSRRTKARDAARAKRNAERRLREDELARLRKLKVDEMEEKVQRIRETGGLKGRDFNVGDWKEVLEADWSDDQWEREMQKRFGETYYADEDGGLDSEGEEANGVTKHKKKPKKPKFDDDIDIKDLVPDFDDDEPERPTFTLSSDDDDTNIDITADDAEPSSSHASKSSKQRKKDRADAKSSARRDRRLIQTLVDDSLQYEAAVAQSKSKAPARFRYRATSPTTFGMTSRDILLASDKQLNEFAGLKKLAAFRDPAKKQKDRKQLSKKARLRQWRKDTFGNVDGPKGGFEALLGEDIGAVGDGEASQGAIDAADGGQMIKKKKKRGKKNKSKAGES